MCFSLCIVCVLCSLCIRRAHRILCPVGLLVADLPLAGAAERPPPRPVHAPVHNPGHHACREPCCVALTPLCAIVLSRAVIRHGSSLAALAPTRRPLLWRADWAGHCSSAACSTRCSTFRHKSSVPECPSPAPLHRSHLNSRDLSSHLLSMDRSKISSFLLTTTTILSFSLFCPGTRLALLTHARGRCTARPNALQPPAPLH